MQHQSNIKLGQPTNHFVEVDEKNNNTKLITIKKELRMNASGWAVVTVQNQQMEAYSVSLNTKHGHKR